MPFKELQRAIRCNNVNELASLIQKGADVNIAGQYGNTPLYNASSDGYDECVRLLLEAGADVNIADMNGDTPLHQASSKGNTECIRLLLEAGADVNIVNRDKKTPLYQASSNGKTDCVRLLLEAGAGANIADMNGDTPLHQASSKGRAECIRLLLEAGADANIANKDRDTPLYQASSKGKTDCVRILLEAGADVNAANRGENTPLYQAASNIRTESVRLLLEAGADANIANRDKQTPLHQASSNGKTDYVRLLLEAGADVNASDRNGDTPLHRASSNGHDECVCLLLEAGADVNASDGYTPLCQASSNGEANCVRILLNAGADANISDSDGRTLIIKMANSLNFGINNKALEIIKLLMGHGAEIQTDTTFFQALNARVQGSLKELKAVKDAAIVVLNANKTLDEDAKIAVEKIANHRIFAPGKTLKDWQSEDFLSASIDCAISIYNSIRENIRQHDEATKNFILENAHLLDESLDSNFKKWKISQLGLKKTLVNLAYICGDKVTGIMSLEKHGKEQVQKFIASITRDDDGNEDDDGNGLITIPEYSVGEFALGEELIMVIRERTSMPVAKHIAKFLPLDWVPFSASQDDDATLGQEVLLGQTVPHGDGMTHGPAVEA